MWGEEGILDVRRKGEFQGLANSEGRDVDVIYERDQGAVRGERRARLTFLIINDFAFVILLHFVGRDASVQHVARDVHIAFASVGDGTKEGGATCSWAAKYETHLPGLENAG